MTFTPLMATIVATARVFSRCGWLWALGLLSGVAGPVQSETIPITLLQLNDVYEITPLADGQVGGLARVATLRRRLLADNPRTYTLLAGDCLGPSALGTATVDGERLAGRQMVAVLNALGLDYATFGNHEFDLTAAQLQQRLRESRFIWVSSNVVDHSGQPFAGVAPARVLTVPGADGGQVRLGLLGLTGPYNRAAYVTYQDPVAAARTQMQTVQADVWIALTHLSLAEDIRLAEAVPAIRLIVGGHEHENVQVWRGTALTPILKADANARTVYVHHLRYDTATGRLTVNSQLQPITADLPAAPEIARLVGEWVERGFQGFRAEGFQPEAKVATTPVPLDGLEASVRNQATELTRLLAHALLREAPDAQLAIYNSGSIRLDDVIQPGPVTQYDVIRILPFGGKVLVVDLEGALLQRVLDQGVANRGTGGYLHTANVDRHPDGRAWLIQGQPLAPRRRYRVALNDFLISSGETGLGFLSPSHPGLTVIARKRDIRFALIAQLQNAFPAEPAATP